MPLQKLEVVLTQDGLKLSGRTLAYTNLIPRLSLRPDENYNWGEPGYEAGIYHLPLLPQCRVSYSLCLLKVPIA